MTELVPVSKRLIGEALVQAVDARDLHAALEVRQRFNDWIKYRIEKCGFVEGFDFVVERGFSENSEKPQGGRPPVDYAISLEMAKHVAMLENNEKGRQARQYFIECERRLREPVARPQARLVDRLSDPEQRAAIDLAMRLVEFSRDLTPGQVALAMQIGLPVAASAANGPLPNPIEGEILEVMAVLPPPVRWHLIGTTMHKRFQRSRGVTYAALLDLVRLGRVTKGKYRNAEVFSLTPPKPPA